MRISDWSSDVCSSDLGIDPLAALGVFGANGLTAYVGLTDVGQIKEGETVVVSAAAGATGSIAVQIAKILGCRVVGIAGTDEKCARLVDDLGLDGAINHRTDDRSEEHTSELQSLMRNSYAVFCLNKKIEI